MLAVVALSASMLVGCGSDEAKYLGEWKGSLEMTQEVPDMGEITLEFDLGLDIKEGGAFTRSTAVTDETVESLKTFVSDNIDAQLQAIIESAGMTEEEAAASVEEAIGMSVDEYVTQSVDMLIEMYATDVLEGEWVIEGDYLYIAKGTADEDQFKLDGDKLILEDAEGNIEFTK